MPPHPPLLLLETHTEFSCKQLGSHQWAEDLSLCHLAFKINKYIVNLKKKSGVNQEENVEKKSKSGRKSEPGREAMA